MASSGVVTGALLERRYRIDALLAHGGMSAVYRGLDTRLDRPVAIKVMDSRFVGDRTFVERFKHEARSAAKIHNPNVVAVHDQGVDSGPDGDLVYLVMELVEGGTLRDLLAMLGRLPVPLTLTIMEQVLSALAAAHTAGLVHRDVKPENVLIGRRSASQHGRGTDPALPSSIIKVGDFGLVRAIAGAGVTSSAVILGTVAYLSPEQVATGAATARSDVYSAAIVLYEMLTGVPPYTGDTAISVAYRHVNDDVPLLSQSLSGIPPALEDLVARATRRDPETRPPDAAAFLTELRQLRDSHGIPVVPVPVPAGEIDVETTSPGFDEPTARNLPVITSAGNASSTPGPHGTMAMARSDLTPGPSMDVNHATYPPPDGQPMPAYPVQRPRNLLLIGIVAVLLLAGAGVGIWWFTAGRWTQVPLVANLQVDEARRTIEEAGLSPNIELARSNDIPAGLVIETKPGNGGDALRGDPITLVVSAGRPVVPDVRAGVSADEAADAIRAVELQPRLDNAVNVFDQRIPKDTVVRLDPQPGTQLRIGDQVTVVLSKGPPVAVPNVTGQLADAALRTLREAGFEPRVVEEFSSSVDGGRVVRTNPAAGSKLDGADSTQVVVVVSTAVTVPDLSGRTVQEAQNALKSLGLSLDVRIGPSRGNARIFIQSPGSGSRVQKGSTVLVGTNLFSRG